MAHQLDRDAKLAINGEHFDNWSDFPYILGVECYTHLLLHTRRNDQFFGEHAELGYFGPADINRLVFVHILYL